MKTPREKNKILPLARVLFTGPAHSEKLSAAQLIAGRLNLELFHVDLASAISKYIGETKKNLSGIFARAEKNNWLLFFDEADALFGKRTEVKDSHDRYAKREAAFFFQRLEDFPQPVIVAAGASKKLPAVWKKNFPTVIHFPSATKSSAKSNGGKTCVSARR